MQRKKRVSALLATHGLQLPARLSTTNFTTIIADNSENVNPDKNEKSSNQIEQFSLRETNDNPLPKSRIKCKLKTTLKRRLEKRYYLIKNF